MSDPRAQRTLVKSPPELWAEISDVSTLARHLGEFGEIRITRLEAETTVAWEGDRVRGTVELEPSGWGTKVTITAAAVGEAAQEEETAPEPVAEPVTEPEPVAEAEAVEPEAGPEPEPEPEPEPVAEAEPTAAARRRGLLARLFGRRQARAAGAIEPVAVTEPDALEPELEPEVAPEPEPEVAPVPEPVVEPALEGEITAAAAPLDDDHVEAVLVAVLDDLGSAHHRPFSRG